MTEDEMVGWNHQLDGHEFQQALGSSVHGILQARKLEVAMPFSKGFSQPRNQTRVSYISYITGKFFTAEPPGKPHPTR